MKLPKAEHASTIKDKEYINITISADGPVYLDKELITMKELKERVLLRYKANHDVSVLLCADKRRSFRDVVRVLDILSGIGITRLDIAAAEQE